MSLKIIDADQMMELLKKHYFRGIKEALAEAPEIVRCEDCKRARDCKTEVFCNLIAAYMGLNDYCSYGERRDNE